MYNKPTFNEFTNSFKSSIKTWDYFVNWEKVSLGKERGEIALNKLNYLLGKVDFDKKFIELITSEPDTLKVLPILIAVREGDIEIYDERKRNTKWFYFNDKNSISEREANACLEFAKNTGIKKLFREDGIKNLVDYVWGVEVGLDSNGRKNRGGALMERIVHNFVKEFAEECGCLYLHQATASKIKKEWGIKVKVNKSERSFDFAIFNPKSKSLKLVETNFYNSGGSKLKSVCGEFKSLRDELKRQKIDLLWITDGKGWDSAMNPLEETYNHNEFVFNLHMLEQGVLAQLDWESV